MTGTKKAIWNTLVEEIKKVQKNDDNIYLDNSRYDYHDFEKFFQDEYDRIKDNYMTKDTEFLDRHKVAAITVKTIIDLHLVGYKRKIASNEVFIGAELIALQVALSYMFKMLEKKIEIAGLPFSAKSYVLPIPMSCNTDYMYIFARNLLYCQECGGIVSIELADKFFLIESLTLKEYRINPKLLKDYK